MNLTIDDITESLRSAGYFSLDEVLFAIIETNGKVSVLPKALNSPVVKQDLKIKTEENSLPITLISEGKIIDENFKQVSVDKQTVLDYIKSLNLKIKNILIFTLDSNGLVYLQEKYKQCKSIETNLKGNL